MKTFLCKLLLFFSIIALIILPFNIVIDPYNVFHCNAPVNNGVEPNKNFIKTKYLIKNPEKFDSLIFGSSRAAFLDAALMEDGNYYNMNSSEAVPAENLHTLKILAEHGFVPRHVILLVDEISCFVDPATHEDVLFRVPYPENGLMNHLRFYMKYLDSYTTLESLSVIIDHKNAYPDPDFLNRYLTTGNDRLDIPPSFTGFNEDGTPVTGYWNDYYELRADEAVADIMELKRFCESQGTTLTIMITPNYYATYLLAAQNGYLEFLEKLSAQTDFYSFAGLNEVTMNPANYFEASHFTPEIGSRMLHTIQGNAPDKPLLEQGFGLHVTSENREEFLDLLYEQLNF